jgi:hypothetical protein
MGKMDAISEIEKIWKTGKKKELESCPFLLWNNPAGAGT